MKFKQLIGAILLSCAVLAFSVPAHAGVFTNVVAFGDSLTDNGPAGGADGYGFYPFTDGDVWVQQLADYHGANLFDVAYGGATTGVGNLYDNIPSLAPYDDTSAWTGLTWQVNNPVINSVYAGMDKDSTLFTVWAGANDFNRGSAIAGALGIEYTDAQQTADAQNAVANIRAALDVIAAQEALHILVPNLMTLTGGTTFSNVYNAELAAALAAFEADFDGTLYTIDIYGLFLEYFLNGVDPASLLWVDGYHPNDVVHTDIAQLAIAATAPVPEPGTAVLFMIGLLGFARVGRRKKM